MKLIVHVSLASLTVGTLIQREDSADIINDALRLITNALDTYRYDVAVFLEAGVSYSNYSDVQQIAESEMLVYEAFNESINTIRVLEERTSAEALFPALTDLKAMVQLEVETIRWHEATLSGVAADFMPTQKLAMQKDLLNGLNAGIGSLVDSWAPVWNEYFAMLSFFDSTIAALEGCPRVSKIADTRSGAARRVIQSRQSDPMSSALDLIVAFIERFRGTVTDFLNSNATFADYGHMDSLLECESEMFMIFTDNTEKVKQLSSSDGIEQIRPSLDALRFAFETQAVLFWSFRDNFYAGDARNFALSVLDFQSNATRYLFDVLASRVGGLDILFEHDFTISLCISDSTYKLSSCRAGDGAKEKARRDVSASDSSALHLVGQPQPVLVDALQNLTGAIHFFAAAVKIFLDSSSTFVDWEHKDKLIRSELAMWDAFNTSNIATSEIVADDAGTQSVAESLRNLTAVVRGQLGYLGAHDTRAAIGHAGWEEKELRILKKQAKLTVFFMTELKTQVANPGSLWPDVFTMQNSLQMALAAVDSSIPKSSDGYSDGKVAAAVRASIEKRHLDLGLRRRKVDGDTTELVKSILDDITTRTRSFTFGLAEFLPEFADDNQTFNDTDEYDVQYAQLQVLSALQSGIDTLEHLDEKLGDSYVETIMPSLQAYHEAIKEEIDIFAGNAAAINATRWASPLSGFYFEQYLTSRKLVRAVWSSSLSGGDIILEWPKMYDTFVVGFNVFGHLCFGDECATARMFTPAPEDRDLEIPLERQHLEIDPIVSINAIFYRAANNVYNYTDFTSKVLSINTSAPSTDATEQLWSGLGQAEWRLFDSLQSDSGTLVKSVASNGLDKFMAGEVLPSLKALHAAIAYELNVLKGLNAKIVALEREGEQIAFLQKQLNLTHQVLDKLYIEKTSDLAAQQVLFEDWTGIYAKLEDGIGFVESLHQPQKRTPRDPDIYDVVLGIQNITELVPDVTDVSFVLAAQSLNKTNFNITDAAVASTLGAFYQTIIETWAIANVSTPVRIYDYHVLEGSLWALREAVYKQTEFFRDHKETLDKANYGQSLAFTLDTTQHLITRLIYAIMDLTIRDEGDEVFAIYIDIDERLTAAVELFYGGEVPEQGLVQAFIEEHVNGGNA